MAVLTNADYTKIRQIAKNLHHATFKAWGLSKQQWMDMFQAAEDWNINGFTTTPTESFKAALETEAGAMTNGQAKAVAQVWAEWSPKV